MNKKIYITLIVLSIIFLSIGSTFALITSTMTATNITQIKSGNLTMTIDGGGSANASFVPAKCTSDNAIKKKIVATATNTSGGKVSFSIGLTITSITDTFKRSTMKYALTTNNSSCTDELIANGNFSNATTGNDIWLIKNDYDNITKSGNTYTKTYYLYIWLDESETEYITGNISVKLKGTTSNNSNLITEATKSIPIYDYIKNNADTTTTIDFSKTSSASNTNGIYMTTDTDSGIPVYYYRGAVDNNVLFANFCWKIIRTTETGGVKLIYNGVQKDEYESAVNIDQSSYTNVENDATYPYTFDSTTKTWTSTNKTNSATGTITFTVDEAGDYMLSYTMSSEKNYDKALFYKNGTKLEEHSGTEAGTIALTGLTTADIIKVEYKKDSSGSSGSDTVTFSIGKAIGTLIKSCNNTTGDATTIGSSAFNSTDDNAKYVGYMYGDSIDDTANTNDSTIKTFIDTWYKNNMTSYTSQLEDTVFCNDRSYTTSGSNLFFGAYTRLITNIQPTLKCQNARDKFTVDASNGNGALTYPVGLITADEMAYAGGVNNTSNYSFYLYNKAYQWAFSPSAFYWSKTYEFNLDPTGVPRNTYVTNSYVVCPVVSLKSGIGYLSGSGTANDPFVIAS